MASRSDPVRIALVATLAFACGCATTLSVGDQELAFSRAVEASQNGKHATAATEAWNFLGAATEDDPRHDRALGLMARSTEALDLTYAASLWYVEIAQARRDVTLLPEAVRGLERIVLSGPHDHETIIRGFLGAEQLSELPSDIQAFVDYHQGLSSARSNLEVWSRARFDRIPESSGYFARAQYVRAVRLVARRKLKAAQDAFERILELEELPGDLEAETHRSLARLNFERHDYKEALVHYERIRELAPSDPELLLEMAWTHYYEGNSRRALGLLYALDAPVYRDLIAPDRFLLEGLALRRLCQFGPARDAARRLVERHGDALADVYSGAPLKDSASLQAAAGHRGATQPVARYRKRLQAERRVLERLEGALSLDLLDHLVGLYDRGISEAYRREREKIALEVDQLADDLLAAEEGVRLILHELGVALLRGRRRPAGSAEPVRVEIPLTGDKVFYRFDGEYWTDELDDLVVFAEDRCID